ncbi:PEP-utilizing enzyme [Kiloniella majae]|uniref:PEP-utilizing enzyme n=1 Tax=Kiloniella majae TaxID=1938558 RepID=UPI000A276F50|nr:PEP-utilizing enzyme [Kiloniella majae]
MPKKIIIIDSVKGERHLDADDSRPASLMPVVNAPVLQWIGKAFNDHDLSNSIYIGGYHIEKVISTFPRMQYRYQDSIGDKGELSALQMVLEDIENDCIIIRGSTLLLREAADILLNNTAELVKANYEYNSTTNFSGILCVHKDKISEIKNAIASILETQPRADLEELINSFSEAYSLDLTGLAAPVYDEPAVQKTIFKGKAQTLEQLSNLMSNAVVLDPFMVSVGQWYEKPDNIIAQLQEVYVEGHIVVRSSTESEDTIDTTGAGYFHSQLDVFVRDSSAIKDAIDNVVSSYSKNGREMRHTDNVLIQRQVENIVMSGVLFTRDLSTGAPYFVINVERGSGRSDVVTSGTEGELETYYVSWDSKPKNMPKPTLALVELAKELIDLTGNSSLDIEFGEDIHGQLYLFQVRPMPPCANQMALEAKDHLDFIGHTAEFVSERMKPVPWLIGTKTIFGNMPDWNPAEMIGTSPSPLGLSLYQFLIGDHAWATARAKIGYKNLEGTPLILSIGGKPYVDVRASLNSLLPEKLDPEIARKLIDTSISILEADTSLQDKVEFEIAVTCLTPSWKNECIRFEESGISPEDLNEFRSSLQEMTNDILGQKKVSFTSLDTDLMLMKQRHELYQIHDDDNVESLAIKARMQIKDCVRLGVVPFSIYARFGFIAMTLLKSFKNIGILNEEDFDLLLQGIPTVASNFTNDIERYKTSELSLDNLIKRYGHLRPNSYDITSYNYAESFESILQQSQGKKISSEASSTFQLDQSRKIFEAHKDEIMSAMNQIGLTVSFEDLFTFIQKSIIGREAAKFEFMRNLDSFMSLVILIGQQLGFSRENLSYLKVDDILNLAQSSKSGVSAKRLERYIGYRKKRMELTKALRIPEVICSPVQLSAFKVESEKPNFITNGLVSAPIIFIENANEIVDLSGKVVLIEAADPGFDWIFSQPIAGLITRYGGAASHMAIRAAEFGIPAAIGCGSVLYELLKKIETVTLDCANQQVGPDQCW